MSFIYADLSHYASGNATTVAKPFEAFTAGTFMDMRGNKVTIPSEDLPKIVENTRALIDSTKASDGTVLGLPIDGNNHDHGDAAGWIVGVELVGNIIRLIPRWTEIGLSKLGKNIQRLFSVSLDLARMAIVGGSLTNWPAVKGLHPIELSQPSEVRLLEFMLDDESFGDYTRRVARAYDDHCKMKGQESGEHGQMAPMNKGWLREVYEGYIVVEKQGQLYKVPFTESGNDFTFADDEEWTLVRYVPVEMSAAQPAVTTPLADAPTATRAASLSPNQEVLDMTAEELKAMLDQFKTELRAEFTSPQPVAGTPPATDPATQQTPNSPVMPTALFDLEAARGQLEAELTSAVEKQLTETVSRLRENANRSLQVKLAELTEHQRVAQFAQHLTDGTLNMRGLAVKAERVEGLLKSLPPQARREVEGLLEDIVSTGFVEFREYGHGRELKRLRELPEHLKAQLDKGNIKITDLSDPIAAPMLEAPIAEYDLSRWMGTNGTSH